ncbi:hypothetical protein CLV40_13845 [Actinokineospora auranticolor]|uniref:TrbC/VIRB2 family protein n=1 Tax=Actinokineospora auranticolor TaxID=155976 RepID=A0A2S6GCL5_9PSEU|nr:hypothetical protein CLV40_13845 [Actinokineospora auranticolor]
MRLNRTHPSLSCDPETAVDRPDTTPTTAPTTPRRCTSDTALTSRRRPRRRGPVVLGLVVLAVLAGVTPAHADTMVLAIAGSVDEVLTNIRNWIMGILALLATVFLTIGGVRRVFGAGDPGEQEKSKEAFKAAGIGYALAALAPLVVTVLKGIVGG